MADVDITFVEACVPVVPMRDKAEERAEMVSQMLFGEIAGVVSATEKWFEVETADGYCGWIDRKTVRPSLLSFSGAAYKNRPIVKSAFASFSSPSSDNCSLYLPMGSRIPDYQEDCGRFEFGNRHYILERGELGATWWHSSEQCVRTAYQLVNTPYLWGGRNFMGIDCSGFVQLVYNINDVVLPRDAWQQALKGKEILSLEDSLPGDLAFFGRPGGKASHVGILISPRTIIHASGCVRIDKIDNRGIYTEKDNYTHQLMAVRRIK